MPASNASLIIRAAAFGSSAPQFSRSALTGRLVASAMALQLAMISAGVTVLRPSVMASPRLVVASASNPSEAKAGQCRHPTGWE